jgi:hypothetical protein
MKKYSVLLLSALLIAVFPIMAQDNSDDTGETGKEENLGPVFDGAFAKISAGPSIYYGDLADYYVFPNFSQFSTHIRSAYKIEIGRDIIGKLGASFHFQKGSLKGTRRPGEQSREVFFRTDYNDMALSVRYRLSESLLRANPYRRYYFNAFIGAGMMWWRSQLYDRETKYTKDYEGYVETESTVNSPNKGLLDKAKRPSIMVIPYGVTFGYRLNYKTDIFVDVTQTNTFTDRLDAWARGWTAKDKYLYIGVGVTYNFNRSEAENGIKKKEKPAKTEGDTEESSEATPASTKKGLFGRRKKSKDDELLNIRLKLFETQLKLFEMQYLLENEQK